MKQTLFFSQLLSGAIFVLTPLGSSSHNFHVCPLLGGCETSKGGRGESDRHGSSEESTVFVVAFRNCECGRDQKDAEVQTTPRTLLKEDFTSHTLMSSFRSTVMPERFCGRTPPPELGPSVFLGVHSFFTPLQSWFFYSTPMLRFQKRSGKKSTLHHLGHIGTTSNLKFLFLTPKNTPNESLRIAIRDLSFLFWGYFQVPIGMLLLWQWRGVEQHAKSGTLLFLALFDIWRGPPTIH